MSFSIGKDSRVTVTNSSSSSGGGSGTSSTPYAILTEQYPSGFNIATSLSAYSWDISSTALLKRRLNTVVSNGITITLANDVSGNFTIAEAGTYAFSGRACFYNIPTAITTPQPVNSRIHISNETTINDNAIIGDSTKVLCIWNNNLPFDLSTVNNWVFIDGTLTIPANTTLSMKQMAQTLTSNGTPQRSRPGISLSTPSIPEVFSVLTIQKIA